ncbi:uncharacterized protein LOC132554150 [Ylistrum balloti]|uniref:uncharacterized protein LOC132554150 n=1 Tax=Ylistrum balloti TaxID=509963 RepID=UPI002905E9ED|nr:uncharacterized protein LOC132554150 [Ylistrum balloti]
MADNFTKNWIMEIPYGDLDGFDAFNAALGTDPAVVTKYKEMKISYKYSRNGDTWTCDVALNGNQVKSFPFSFDKDMEQEGMDGKIYKCIYKMEGDVWVETSVPKDGGNKGVTVRRFINGNIMTSKTTVNGTDPPISLTIPRKGM